MSAFHIIYLLIFFLSVVKALDSFSQQPDFTSVQPPGGGWGSPIFSCSQDSKGYMWIGSWGVHRYDGYTYKSYYHDPRNPSSLAYNRTEAICADHKGFIWVGTNGKGLDRLDPQTGIFTHFRHNPSDSNSISNDTISAILEDREGKIWVGTEHSGLNCIDPETETIIRFRHNPLDSTSLSYDKVTTLYEDRQGTIWVGTGYLWHGGDLTLRDLTLKHGGLNRYNRKSNNFNRYLHDPNDPSTLIDNRVRTISEDSKGTFWVGTSGDGLHTMNREKGSFERHRYNAMDPNGLSRPPVESTLPWADDMITFIREDAAGTVWIGTLMGGLNSYNPKTRKMNYYRTLKDKLTDKDREAFWWSYTSKDGVFWIFTWDGVYRTDPFHKQIPNYNVGSPVTILLQDSASNLWLGSGITGIAIEGLIRYDAGRVNKKRFVHDRSDSTSLSSNYVYSILQDYSGSVWIGTQNGLNRYDPQSEKFTRYLSSKHNYGITAIYEDRDRLFWLGTNVANEGLILMNRKDGTLTHYRPSTTDSTGSSYRIISCIIGDKSGYLWIGTFQDGLSRFDKNTKAFQHYLPETYITNILEDADGVVWIGTSNGLYYFNRSNNSFVLFNNQTAGLTEGIGVRPILEDDQQSLWINTNDGLFRLRHNRNQISFYGKRQGISSVSGGFRGKGGELFFGHDNGYYAFYPEQLTTNTTAPDLHITGFSLGDQVVDPGDDSSLTEHIWQADKINLSYNENVFSFDFAGIHYSSPEDNRHLYMLENFDNGWRKSGEEKTAFYSSVSPGKYVFRVKAASSDGVWQEKSIVLIISPPWWKSWWAFFIYGLLLIAGVSATHRIQKKRVIKAERERIKEKELEQAKEIEKAYTELKATQTQLIQSEKMASLGELTAGIAHEIQNPLNFVNNFSEVNIELADELKNGLNQSTLTPDEKNILVTLVDNVVQNQEKISHHGKRADAIVKGMLQHSRSSGVKELTDINTLVDEYLRLAYHGLRAKDKSFNATLNTNFDKSIEKVNVVPQDIGRATLNLITNAFYAVSEMKKRQPEGYEPTVTLSTKRSGHGILISVKDNGIGIPHKVLDKIFQPFFTTKHAGQGTGLGLSLSYDIVKAHGGELKVETKEGSGSEFIVHIPLI